MDHGWAAGFECRRHGSDGVGVAVGCAPVAGAVAALVVPLVACHRLLVSFEFFFLLASLVWFPFWLLVSCPLFWLWRLAFLLRVARALRVDFLCCGTSRGRRRAFQWYLPARWPVPRSWCILPREAFCFVWPLAGRLSCIVSGFSYFPWINSRDVAANRWQSCLTKKRTTHPSTYGGKLDLQIQVYA